MTENLRALILDSIGGCNQDSAVALAQFKSGGEGIWVHLKADNADSASWLGTESNLHEVAIQSLLSEETRPRTLTRGNRLLLTLRGANTAITRDADDLISLRLWSDGKRLVSSYLRPLACSADLRQWLEDGEGPIDIAGAITLIVDAVVDSLHETMTTFEDQVLIFEDTLFESTDSDSRSKLSLLRKQLISVRRYLVPQREALERLASSTIDWLDDNHRIAIRESNDRLTRFIEQIEELRDRASLAQEELVARLSEDTSRRSYVFAVVATLFLPLGFLTGLLGINVGGMPGVDNEMAFWWVTGICGSVGSVLLIAFRVNRWL